MTTAGLRTVIFICFTFLIHLTQSAILGADTSAFSLKVHPTFGLGGGIRRLDAVIPGETLFFAIKCDGVEIDKSGDCRISLKYELINSSGKTIESEDCGEILQQITFRRSVQKRTARLHFKFGLSRSIDPGKYVLKVSATQGLSTEVDSVDLTIVPPDQFAIGYFELSNDMKKERVKGNCFNVGNVSSVHFVVQGLRSVGGKVRTEISVRALDLKGNPVCIKDFKRGTETESSISGYIPFYAGVFLPEAGEFFLQLSVRDLETNQTLVETIPIVVVDSWSEL